MSSLPQSWASGSTTTTARSTDSTPPTSTSSHSQPLPFTNTRYRRTSTDKPYPGSGTSKDPFVVDWTLGDPENPFNWSRTRRWFITAQVRCILSFALIRQQNNHPHSQLALSTFTVSFSSSAYTGGLQGIQHDLNVSSDVAILGISLYVLGFALGCFHSPT